MKTMERQLSTLMESTSIPISLLSMSKSITLDLNINKVKSVYVMMVTMTETVF